MPEAESLVLRDQHGVVRIALHADAQHPMIQMNGGDWILELVVTAEKPRIVIRNEATGTEVNLVVSDRRIEDNTYESTGHSLGRIRLGPDGA